MWLAIHSFIHECGLHIFSSFFQWEKQFLIFKTCGKCYKISFFFLKNLE